jgi:uncharacterized protein YjbI with pentapeptide repeats
MIARITNFIASLPFKIQSTERLLNTLSTYSNPSVLRILYILREREVFQNGQGRGANFAHLNGQHIPLASAILEQANFQHAHLKEAYFGKSQLSGANFREADITQANFRDATLTNADFTQVKARHAYFAGANLQGAKFDGADLRGANFWNANLTGASWDGALTDDETLMPD